VRHRATSPDRAARASPSAVAECHHRAAGRLPCQYGQAVAATGTKHGQLAGCAPCGDAAHLHAAAACTGGRAGVQCAPAVRQTLARQAHGELTVCADEKTSIQARQRVTPTKAAAPGEVLQVADRYKRMGALQLFCALVVASGLTFAQTRTTKKFVDFKAFLQA